MHLRAWRASITAKSVKSNQLRVRRFPTRKKTSVLSSQRSTTAKLCQTRKLSSNMSATMEKFSESIKMARKKSSSIMESNENLTQMDTQLSTSTIKISSRRLLMERSYTSLLKHKRLRQLSLINFRCSNSATVKSRNTSLIGPKRSCKLSQTINSSFIHHNLY